MALVAHRLHRREPMQKTSRRAFASWAFVVVAGIGRTARAHAKLTDATPRDGATVDRAPDRVVLHFSSGVERRYARLSLAAASRTLRLSLERSEENGLVRELSARIPPLGEGLYVVSYDVVAADGHRVTGSTSFTVRG